MKAITPELLFERYDAFLVDAYGVLVTSSGIVPGADRFVSRAEADGLEWSIVTNDASRLPETCAHQFGELLGLEIDPARVVTAGSMLARWTSAEGLEGARAFVLGTRESKAYAERAGLELVEPEDAEIFIVGDEAGYDFLPRIDAVLTAMVRRVVRGRELRQVCPNADLIYPKGDGGYGVAAGSIASMLSAALESRFPGRSFPFEHLGKPNPQMFLEARDRLGVGQDAAVVALGDTPATDVVGARAAGFDVVLVGDAEPDPNKKPEVPTWHLRSW